MFRYGQLTASRQVRHVFNPSNGSGVAVGTGVAVGVGDMVSVGIDSEAGELLTAQAETNNTAKLRVTVIYKHRITLKRVTLLVIWSNNKS